jgi:shikimate dehydrogenase
VSAPDFLPGITGSFAQKAAENPTVAIVEAAYAQAGLHVRYLNCEVGPDDLGDAVRGARAMGWLGFNCSLPHKVAVIEYLDSLAPSASIIGAVNCVVNRDGRLIGENTDGKGFVDALVPVVSPIGTRVVIFGAGGAARAIAVETALAGAVHLTIVNTTPSRGEELTALINAKTPASATFVHWNHTYAVPADTNIVINATSIGFHPDVDARLNLDVDSLLPTMTVADVITNPPLTQLLKNAAARGCTTIDGLGMLVNQARVAITLWTGEEVATAVMRERLEEMFSSNTSTTG